MPMRPTAIFIPAYQAEHTVAAVIERIPEEACRLSARSR
jgi:hypothetical protein